MMVLVIIEKISSHNENFSPHDGVGKIQVFPLFTIEAISFVSDSRSTAEDGGWTGQFSLSK